MTPPLQALAPATTALPAAWVEAITTAHAQLLTWAGPLVSQPDQLRLHLRPLVLQQLSALALPADETELLVARVLAGRVEGVAADEEGAALLVRVATLRLLLADPALAPQVRPWCAAAAAGLVAGTAAAWLATPPPVAP